MPRPFLSAFLLLAAVAGCAQPPVSAGTGAVAPGLTLAGEWRNTPPGPAEKGCFTEQKRPAVVETVTEQVLVAPEVRDKATGAVTRPASYRTTTQARIVEGGETLWFETLCPRDLTRERVATLQRALAARGLYLGAVTGKMDRATQAAVRAYQAPRGLLSAILSRRAAEQMGVVPVRLPGVGKP